MNLDYNPSLWSFDEIEILRIYYGNIPIKDLQDKLYDIKKDYFRSKRSIKSKAFLLGVTQKRILIKWNESEIQFLKDNYKLKNDKEIAKILNKSVYSVHKMKLNKFSDLLDDKSFNQYSKDELNYLIQNQYEPITKLSNYLNRNRSGVVYQMKKMNIYHVKKRNKK